MNPATCPAFMKAEIDFEALFRRPLVILRKGGSNIDVHRIIKKGDKHIEHVPGTPYIVLDACRGPIAPGPRSNVWSYSLLAPEGDILVAQTGPIYEHDQRIDSWRSWSLQYPSPSVT